MVETIILDSADLEKSYKLVQKENEWCAVSEDGQRSFGCFPTETEARERLHQVEAAKAAKNAEDAEFEEFQNSGRTSDTNGHWHAFTEESDRTGPPSDNSDEHTHSVTRGKDGKVTFEEEAGHTHDASVDILSAHGDDKPGLPDDKMKKKKKKLFDLDAGQGADAGSDAEEEVRIAELVARIDTLNDRWSDYHQPGKHAQKKHGRKKKGVDKASAVSLFIKRPGGINVFDVSKAATFPVPNGWAFQKKASVDSNSGIWKFQKDADNIAIITFDPRGKNNISVIAKVRGAAFKPIVTGRTANAVGAGRVISSVMKEANELDFGEINTLRKIIRKRVPGLGISAKTLLHPDVLAAIGGVVGGSTVLAASGGTGFLAASRAVTSGIAAGKLIGQGLEGVGLSEDKKAKDYEKLNNIQGIEIFRTGKWNGDSYNEKDLDDMVFAFGRESSGFVPPVKVGHTKESGTRAFGWVEAIRRENDKLVADFVDVPDKVFALIKDRGLDTVSAEIFWNLQRGEKKFRRVLKAVALLGAEIPAVSGLAPLRTVVNSLDEQDSFEQVMSYELKPYEVRSMDKIDELAAQIEDLETKLSEAEDAKVELETEAEKSDEFAEQLEEAVQARNEAEDELKTAKVELAKAYKAKDTEIVELTKQVKSLQAAQDAASEEKRVDNVERKAEYCKVPALREHVKSLYDVATASERQVNFTQGDKTEELTAEQVVDKLVEAINSDATKLFREISEVEATNRTDTYIDAGVEVDKRVREYQAKHADMAYEIAQSTVLASDPELAKAYAAS